MLSARYSPARAHNHAHIQFEGHQYSSNFFKKTRFEVPTHAYLACVVDKSLVARLLLSLIETSTIRVSNEPQDFYGQHKTNI